MKKTISTRGRTFTGTVTSDKMSKTVTVAWTRRHYIPKFERYEKRRTKIKAHNPDEIDARTGDRVVIMETRPLSKTKHFIVIKKLEATEQAAAPKPAKPQEEKTAPQKKEQAAKKPAAKKAPKKTTEKKSASS